MSSSHPMTDPLTAQEEPCACAATPEELGVVR
jgi:hypothetical protein